MSKWTYEQCKAEADFIKSVNPLAPGDVFNNDRGLFVDYCALQIEKIKASSFPMVASDIIDAWGIAKFTK